MDHLKRRIGLGLLTAYGVGVMVGAGIYVLVGAVAAEAGVWSPLAFLLSGLVAAPTALSYCELSTRMPEAGGEAVYVGRGFNSVAAANFVGLAIVVAGIISSAAVLRGGVGYLLQVVDMPEMLALVVVGGFLVALAMFGSLESLVFAAICTVIELGGLGLVIWAGFSAPPVPEILSPPQIPWVAVGAGALLAFFAFLGFEDLVNMAEEVRDPNRNMPRAILLSLVITTIIYCIVAYAALRALPVSQLIGNESPLTAVWTAGMGGEGRFFSSIAVFAALNGVLAQIVMASRMLYGLGKTTPALSVFHVANARTGTPLLATALVGGLAILSSLFLPLATLAEVTSFILLAVFLLVNMALIAHKRRSDTTGFRVPVLVPWIGLGLSAAALALYIATNL
ncbi:APC family permease [Shimia biformata]|uniref:APC family permease n=1 Tax=Shimia biformata TaxID=1294299 RepID=UPI00194DB0B6|nr:amino acid permease [Shimia biformata]